MRLHATGREVPARPALIQRTTKLHRHALSLRIDDAAKQRHKERDDGQMEHGIILSSIATSLTFKSVNM
jgi:hypothetical protein